MWSQAEPRKVLGVIGADMIEQELPIAQAESAFNDEGQLLDPERQAPLTQLVDVPVARAGAQLAQAA